MACRCKFGSFSLHMDTIALWEPMYFWFRNAQSNPSHATSENAFLKEIQDVLYSPNPMVKKTTQLPASCDTLPACMHMCLNLFWIWWQGCEFRMGWMIWWNFVVWHVQYWLALALKFELAFSFFTWWCYCSGWPSAKKHPIVVRETAHWTKGNGKYAYLRIYGYL